MTESIALTEKTNIIDKLKGITFDAIIPRDIFVFGFPRGMDIYESYKRGDYTSEHLTLAENSIFNLDFLWPEYMEYIETHPEYEIDTAFRNYLSKNQEISIVYVNAIGRKTPFSNGTKPIAYSTLDRIYYADIVPDLELPECFKS